MIKLERVNRDYFSVRGHPRTRIHRKAHVDSTVKIQDKVHVGANCSVLDYAVLMDDTSVLSNGVEPGPTISGAAVVTGISQLLGKARVAGSASVRDSVISGTATVDGRADVVSSYVGGDSRIGGDARFHKSTTDGTVCVGDSAVVIQSNMYDGSSAYDVANASCTYITGHLRGQAPVALGCCRWPILMPSHNEVAVGCQSHSIEEWLSGGSSMIPWKAYNVTREEKALIRTIIRGMRRISQQDGIWKLGKG